MFIFYAVFLMGIGSLLLFIASCLIRNQALAAAEEAKKHLYNIHICMNEVKSLSDEIYFFGEHVEKEGERQEQIELDRKRILKDFEERLGKA